MLEILAGILGAIGGAFVYAAWLKGPGKKSPPQSTVRVETTEQWAINVAMQMAKDMARLEEEMDQRKGQKPLNLEEIARMLRSMREFSKVRGMGRTLTPKGREKARQLANLLLVEAPEWVLDEEEVEEIVSWL